MAAFPICTFIILLHFGTLLIIPAQSYLLQPCEPVNETVSVEKEGCPKCLVFQTTICSGHCLTKEPVYKSPFSTIYQHVCTYRDVRYEIVRLPDCPPGVDPHVTYPVALSCDCSLCTMDTSDCTIESLKPDFCMTQREFIVDY
ncbi:lutropin subunit beta [Astyanax mexicanus]|uniref:Gonadotropin subunit beta-like n=2 Tax=Astyanax mexicanus TaxID=7994 RepID=A0A8B9R5E5_ASTMX|nr:lutropin subunit beta [Astyanax mexicanus]KAG9275034.1 gonadotropin subunit beta-like [Astyanax mexicanus]